MENKSKNNHDEFAMAREMLKQTERMNAKAGLPTKSPKEDKTHSFAGPVLLTVIMLAYALGPASDGGSFQSGLGMFSIPIGTLWLGWFLGKNFKS